MDNLTESKAASGIGGSISRLCSYKLKTDYSIKLDVCKGESTSPECSHSFTGSSDHCLVKLVALIAVGSLSLCLLSSLCSFFKRLLNL